MTEIWCTAHYYCKSHLERIAPALNLEYWFWMNSHNGYLPENPSTNCQCMFYQLFLSLTGKYSSAESGTYKIVLTRTSTTQQSPLIDSPYTAHLKPWLKIIKNQHALNALEYSIPCNLCWALKFVLLTIIANYVSQVQETVARTLNCISELHWAMPLAVCWCHVIGLGPCIGFA